MSASQASVDLVQGYYRCLDEGRFDECDRFLTADARLQIAHHTDVAGLETIVALTRAGMSRPAVNHITHDVKNVWDAADGVVIFEVHATYEMTDGRTIVVPGVVIGEIDEGKFRSQRIAADLSPIFGAL